MTITVHQITDYIVYTSTGLSLLYSVLPKVETFQSHPRFQRGYELFLNIIKQLGSNLRVLLHPEIDTAGGSKVSIAAATEDNPPEPPKP